MPSPPVFPEPTPGPLFAPSPDAPAGGVPAFPEPTPGGLFQPSPDVLADRYPGGRLRYYASATWGGVEWPLLSARYEPSVGVSPQAVVLRLTPQDGATLPQSGTLQLAGPRPLLAADPGVPAGATGGPWESVTLIRLRDCVLDAGGFAEDRSGGGRVWTLRVLDRRWKWAVGPAVYGHYNQRDRRNKLVPKTVRSPYQLAKYLLGLMGESPPPGRQWHQQLPPVTTFADGSPVPTELGYTADRGPVLDLPGGLAYPFDGDDPAHPLARHPAWDTPVDPAAEYLALGENLPPTGTNPEVSWDGIPAARALADLCDRFGCVVVWCPVTDQASVQRVGAGTGLPPGHALSAAPTLDPPVRPSAVRVVGAPTRFQLRLKFRAVGKDWDGSWKPIDELSYAPDLSGTAAADFTQRWLRQMPPAFVSNQGATTWGVKPTDRLSIQQALALARDTVYRCYQLVAERPYAGSDPDGEPDRPFAPDPPPDPLPDGVDAGGDIDPSLFAIPVPGVGPVDDRYRVLIQDTRPEQIAPVPGDETRIDIRTNRPFAAEVYDGYSKDSLPRVFASVWWGVQDGTVWNLPAALDADLNTPATARLYVPWSVADPERQVIRFDRPLFRRVPAPTGCGWPTGANRYTVPADPVVETGAVVLDADTRSPVRYVHTLPLSGGLGPARDVVIEEVQSEYLGGYDDTTHRLTGGGFQDADAAQRAAYYAERVAAQYQLTSALAVRYVGLVPVVPSGLVRQVGWEFGRDGFYTTAAANTEFSKVVLPYPERRRRENEPPDAQTAELNARGFQAGVYWMQKNAALKLHKAVQGMEGG